MGSAALHGNEFWIVFYISLTRQDFFWVQLLAIEEIKIGSKEYDIFLVNCHHTLCCL
jgi:hypothetical protein